LKRSIAVFHYPNIRPGTSRIIYFGGGVLNTCQQVRTEDRPRILIEITHGDEVCVLRLGGHFRSGEHLDYVRDKGNEVRSHDCKNMLADFRELQSIGSTGIGFVVGVFVYITKRSVKGRFIVVGANQRVRTVFDVTRLSTIIPLAADLPSGLAALHGEGLTARGPIEGLIPGSLPWASDGIR
jgi:anti-anti-sigma factor